MWLKALAVKTQPHLCWLCKWKSFYFWWDQTTDDYISIQHADIWQFVQNLCVQCVSLRGLNLPCTLHDLHEFVTKKGRAWVQTMVQTSCTHIIFKSIRSCVRWFSDWVTAVGKHQVKPLRDIMKTSVRMMENWKGFFKMLSVISHWLRKQSAE